MQKHDQFLTYLYTFSQLSDTSRHLYMRWITKCCEFHNTQHCLDITPSHLQTYRLHLLNHLHYAPASDTIIFSAMRHTYCVLLPFHDADAAIPYQQALQHRPRQQYRLPQTVSQNDIQQFLAALPNTACGHILRDIYTTSRPFEICAANWKCSKQYAQSICAHTARHVGLPHGFGISGLRSASILHRLQNRTNDIEIKAILDDCELSPAQFQRYLKVINL